MKSYPYPLCQNVRKLTIALLAVALRHRFFSLVSLALDCPECPFPTLPDWWDHTKSRFTAVQYREAGTCNVTATRSLAQPETFYTTHLFQLKCFTPGALYTASLLHQKPFEPEAFYTSQKGLTPPLLSHQKTFCILASWILHDFIVYIHDFSEFIAFMWVPFLFLVHF